MTTAADDVGSYRRWEPGYPLDLRLTLLVHQRGPRDPAFRVGETGAIWRTSLTPSGPGTLRIAGLRTSSPGSAQSAGSPLVVAASAWGPGAAWLLTSVPDLLGAADDPDAFAPVHPQLRDLASRYQGLRLGRTNRVLEALVPAVLEQKVVGVEARRAWRWLLTRFGTPAPGPAPAGMRVFPAPETWLAIPSWEWHRAGVEAVRARTIANAARVAARLEAISLLPSSQADRALTSLAGVGPWTSAETRQRACGDPDAVSVGDYHLPAAVGWVLTGHPTDDAGMLALLAPYDGQRHRAARLAELAGGPPRRGPRLAVRDYRAI